MGPMKRGFARALGTVLLLTLPARGAVHRLPLTAAIAAAESNPLARAASEERRVAEARLREVEGLRFPHVELTSFLAPSPEIHCENADCTRTRPHEVAPAFRGVFGGARLEAIQPLYTFGKLDAASGAAERLVKMNAALADGTRGDLAFETTRAYFGLRLAREIGAVLQDGADQLRAKKQSLEERLEHGDAAITVQDRLRIETLEAELEMRLAQAHEQAAIALSGLRALVGDAEADIEDQALEPVDFPLAGVDRYVRDAESARPDLRAGRQGVAALGEQVKLERARYLPDLALVGGATLTRAQGVDQPPSAFAYDPFNATTAELALVLRWSADVVSQSARIDRARAEQNRGKALLEAATAGAQFAVHQAYEQATGAKSRLEAAQRGEKTARGWVASVVQAEAVGTASVRDLADAYLAYFTLKTRVLESTYDWNLAVAALRRAIGSLAPQSHP